MGHAEPRLPVGGPSCGTLTPSGHACEATAPVGSSQPRTECGRPSREADAWETQGPGTSGTLQLPEDS